MKAVRQAARASAARQFARRMAVTAAASSTNFVINHRSAACGGTSEEVTAAVRILKAAPHTCDPQAAPPLFDLHFVVRTPDVQAFDLDEEQLIRLAGALSGKKP